MPRAAARTDQSWDVLTYLTAVPVGIFTGFWLGALMGQLSERRSQALQADGA